MTRRGAAAAAASLLLVPALALAAATGPTIKATGGTPQTATISTAFAHKLSARVLGAKGNPRVGLLVTFTAPSTGPSVTFPNGRATWSHATGKKGYVRVVVTANGTAGKIKVTANLKKGALKTPATFNLTSTP
ncbi:MAG TPA: hypothetical protein VGL44_10390 [Gaiellales bacterium]